MQALRQMGGGIIIAIISIVLVVGGIALSLTETGTTLNTPTPLPPPTQPVELFAATSTTSLIATVATSTETPTTIPTATIAVSSPTFCPIPAGWFQIYISANDTLYTIAERYKTTAEQLSAANCLTNLNPPAGSPLYVPPVIATITAIPCGAPFGWVKTYVVKSGDTLFRIASSYGITYPQLQKANCMGTSTTIYAGQLLWVPNIPTLTPAVPPTNTPNPTSTTDFSTSTFFPTNTPLPTSTTDFSTPTFEPTSTPAPTSTTAALPTLTPFPTQTKTSP